MAQSRQALFALASWLALFAPIASATAQNAIGSGNPLNQLSMPEAQEDPRMRERREAVDREYRASKGSLPTQTGAVDPWANMRGTDEAKAAPKPVQKQSANAGKKKPAQ